MVNMTVKKPVELPPISNEAKEQYAKEVLDRMQQNVSKKQRVVEWRSKLERAALEGPSQVPAETHSDKKHKKKHSKKRKHKKEKEKEKKRKHKKHRKHKSSSSSSSSSLSSSSSSSSSSSGSDSDSASSEEHKHKHRKRRHPDSRPSDNDERRVDKRRRD